MKWAEDIGMVEKIKIKWDSEDTFSVEYVNYSTTQVRKLTIKEELKDNSLRAKPKPYTWEHVFQLLSEEIIPYLKENY